LFFFGKKSLFLVVLSFEQEFLAVFVLVEDDFIFVVCFWI